MQRRFAVAANKFWQAVRRLEARCRRLSHEQHPARKLGAPPEPPANGRASVWSFLASRVSAMTVPVGLQPRFTTRIRDPKAPPPPPGWARGGGGAGVRSSASRSPPSMVGPTARETSRRHGHRRPAVQRAHAPHDRRPRLKKATHHRIAAADFGPLKPDVPAAQ